jgi:dATP pyrophosphohydrolase
MRVRSESVCALVFRRAAPGVLYLMLRRSATRGGFWQSVSGHVKRGEGAEGAARREVSEETGLEPKAVIQIEKVNIFFEPHDDAVYLEPCFGVEVTGNEPVLSHEHDAYCWSTLADALRVLPFAGVRAALTELDRQLATAGPSGTEPAASGSPSSRPD